MEFSFAEVVDRYSLLFEVLHERKRHFFFQNSQVMKEILILCSPGLADNQTESIQMIIDIGNRELCVLPGFQSA